VLDETKMLLVQLEQRSELLSIIVLSVIIHRKYYFRLKLNTFFSSDMIFVIGKVDCINSIIRSILVILFF